jgi:hypothetical protein
MSSAGGVAAVFMDFLDRSRDSMRRGEFPDHPRL